jgi:glycosyltransferase involved in cell wall biosynthesis
MEAMALGIPVVASDIPGNRELVEQRRTGLLFSLDDPGRLADAILYIIEHPEYARDMCRQAREMIEKQYSARRMAKDYLSLYKTVSGKFDQGCV